jgi:pSer/pThr/pTyr-binding forkhead associated (FHA) protein
MAALQAFISYSRRDEKMRRRLITSTAALSRDVPVQVWSDRAIEPGDSWSFAIDFRLGAADVFIALISSEYLASEACVAELDRALELRAQGHIALVPILLETCDWRHGPLSSIQLLPTDGRPISRWPSKDQAWSNIVDELRRTFESIPDQGNPQWTLLAKCDGQDYRVPMPRRGTPLTIGRRNGLARLRLPDTEKSISRNHCSIFIDDRNDLVVQDLHSKNGTFVNEDRVAARNLMDGDRVRIGNVLIEAQRVPATATGLADSGVSTLTDDVR